MRPSHIVIFDGVCVLCESSVRFIIKHDKAGLFKFAAAQSDMGRKLLTQLGVEAMASQTLILVKDGKAYQKSDAALEIAGSLDGPWKALAVFKIIPRWLRDPIYSIMARQRYRWFGRNEACMIPDDPFKDRFL
jgi:predicted DCC family thiol-disulfide oxidoreductase YuxK